MSSWSNPLEVYKNCRIYFDPKPIPLRQFDYDWCHNDYNGPGDNRCGYAASVEKAKEEIDKLEIENETF